jgi:gamma-glutamyltranspeptidase / glutathione hydrolase
MMSEMKDAGVAARSQAQLREVTVSRGPSIRRRPRPLHAVFVSFVAFFLVVALPASATEKAPGKAAIASAHPLASQAGLDILAKGGNAFDAAVAVAGALAVVEPSGSGLGGGGFILVHRASDSLNVMIDAREKAPAAATRDMYLGPDGKPVPRLSTDSALAAGIPGEPAGLALLAQKYGKLPLKTSLQPAIRLAREGFPLYERLRNIVQNKQATLKKSTDASRVYLTKKGDVPENGTVIKQPDLARTLELFAEKGADGYYKGAFAKKLADGVRKLGGNWTEQDLAEYRAVERAPIVGTYHGARIISSSPPASGGIALVDALNILEPYDIKGMDAVGRTHLVVEAMRRMHRDRALYLGDPDFTKVPVEMLTDKHYAQGQRTSLRMDRATPSDILPSDAIDATQGPHTTHFSVIDRDGNRVGMTITLNLLLGSGLMVPGTGILLNNQMDDFSIKPGTPNAYQLIGADANSIAPGKRPLSSSTPTFIESERGVMILGSPGGSYITGMVLLATLDFISGKSAKDIVGAPRIHHQYFPDVIQYEPGALSAEQVKGLSDRGHKLREGRRWGNLQVVVWDYATGEVEAASDPRGVGAGLVY